MFSFRLLIRKGSVEGCLPAPYRSWGGEVTSSAFRAGIASCLSGASQSYRLLGKPGKEPENDTGRFPRTGEHQGDMSSPPSTIEFSLFLGGTASYYAVLGRYASSGIITRMPLLVLMWGKGCLTIKSLAMKTAPGVKNICDPANHEQSRCTGV